MPDSTILVVFVVFSIREQAQLLIKRIQYLPQRWSFIVLFLICDGLLRHCLFDFAVLQKMG